MLVTLFVLLAAESVATKVFVQRTLSVKETDPHGNINGRMDAIGSPIKQYGMNSGNKKYEEKLKLITLAYTQLKNTYKDKIDTKS